MRTSKVVAILTILTVVGGSIAAIILGREPYPFSDYPMYSRSFTPKTYTYLELIGVTENNTEWKIPVVRIYRPLTEAALIEAIMVHYRNRTHKNRDIIAGLLKQYEKRRQLFMPEAPALKGLRLYQAKFDWQKFREEKLTAPAGAPFNPPPQDRELLHEVFQ